MYFLPKYTTIILKIKKNRPGKSRAGLSSSKFIALFLLEDIHIHAAEGAEAGALTDLVHGPGGLAGF